MPRIYTGGFEADVVSWGAGMVYFVLCILAIKKESAPPQDCKWYGSVRMKPSAVNISAGIVPEKLSGDSGIG